MKRKNVIRFIGAAILGLSLSSCEAMWDSSIDIPLGYGGNVGVSVSNVGYSPWVNNWTNYVYTPWNGLGWNPAPVRPIVTPVRPALRPGTINPPANNWRPPVNSGNSGNSGNWRPPVNNLPNQQAPSRPGNSNISYRPVSSMPQIPANANNPKPEISQVKSPGRH